MIAVAHRMMTQSECNVGWLIFVLRARRRQQVRQWRGRLKRLPRLRLIAGGRDLPDEALRQRIRERLAEGSLFPASGMSVARRGTACVPGLRQGHHEGHRGAGSGRAGRRSGARRRGLLSTLARGITPRATATSRGLLGSNLPRRQFPSLCWPLLNPRNIRGV